MMKNRCQSCGMPLNQDPKKGGTEKDGSRSTEYCSYCYENGAFYRPDWTAKEMQKFCQEKLQEMGKSRFVAWLLCLDIPRLRRWKKAA